MSVSFREYKTLEDQLRELNLLSPDHTKHRVVRQGDTLSRIAAEEYDDPAQWRAIALHQPNRRKIGNPRRLVPGTALEIPVLGSGPLLFEE